jgi:hypothetical protein
VLREYWVQEVNVPVTRQWKSRQWGRARGRNRLSIPPVLLRKQRPAHLPQHVDAAHFAVEQRNQRAHVVAERSANLLEVALLHPDAASHEVAIPAACCLAPSVRARVQLPRAGQTGQRSRTRLSGTEYPCETLSANSAIEIW